MKITREIKTAILVIASILLFIWGYSFLKGRDLLTDYKTFFVEYDNVEGLGKTAPVTINGLVVGKVNSITLQNSSGKLIVELQIKSDFPISKSSIVNIYEPGLIGGKQIQIVPNFNDKSIAESGSTLQGGTKPGLTDLVAEKLTPLQRKVEKMVASTDSLLTNLNKVLDAKTRENLKSSIANLDQTLAEFKIASKSVNTILDENKGKIGGIVTNFNKVSNNFSKISDSLSKANIGKTVKNLENTLSKVNAIMSDVQAGKGTFGKLMKDDALYTNFNKTSKELELLMQDLRLNPTRYVNVSLFGKKNKPYIMPVNDTIKK
ncbi:MlaD family protein [Flavobacterium psychrotolerans]|uniref:MCE family protein n=1 Tax=Flavobacterium psychrotolerans TaxID=2169410 RepID=A0A2U1JGL3_9FLAO|nr:MlaD family protein [Flavobacterium psychrotolerans]PWA04078.1 MCE family protein [Flavobacterium psychrotolerans]